MFVFDVIVDVDLDADCLDDVNFELGFDIYTEFDVDFEFTPSLGQRSEAIPDHTVEPKQRFKG